jgi:hypothetical protein
MNWIPPKTVKVKKHIVMIANNWSRFCVCVCVFYLSTCAKLSQAVLKNHFYFPHKKKILFSTDHHCLCTNEIFHHLLKGLATCITDGIIMSASNPHLLQPSQPLGRASSICIPDLGMVPIALRVRTAWRAVPGLWEWLASPPLYWPCTRAPQGCVLSPLLYFLSTPDYVVTTSSNLWS